MKKSTIEILFPYLVIPRFILGDKKLTDSEKIRYSYLFTVSLPPHIYRKICKGEDRKNFKLIPE